VDWSRKEESKRIVAEDTMREALDRLDEQEGRHEEEAGQLRRDCLALREALDASNEANAAKHRQLLEREAQYMEVSKELAVADKLATTCERESSALKHLCGKLEVELDGTKSRLKSVEVSSSNHISEISESVKVLQRDNAGAARELEHWKKAYENSEHKSGALLNDVEEAKRALKMSESRVAEVLGNQRQYEHKVSEPARAKRAKDKSQQRRRINGRRQNASGRSGRACQRPSSLARQRPPSLARQRPPSLARQRQTFSRAPTTSFSCARVASPPQ
jgi:chromosome segregation ATPase